MMIFLIADRHHVVIGRRYGPLIQGGALWFSLTLHEININVSFDQAISHLVCGLQGDGNAA